MSRCRLSWLWLLNGRAAGRGGESPASRRRGFACSALCRSAWFRRRGISPARRDDVGRMLAFYQVGYGIAAFGVGPLRDHLGFAYATTFAFGGLVALILAGVAWLVVGKSTQVAH